MFDEMIVVAVTPFSGTSTPDKNGANPVMLQCIAGKMPNRNVLSGTVAERAGIEVGKTYLMKVREQGFDKQFGLDFNFIKVRELTTGEDISKTCKDIGKAEIISIGRPEGFEEAYQRKGDVVEGLRKQRIREGLYIPAIPTSVEHPTAQTVHAGSSTEGDVDLGFNNGPLPGEEEENERDNDGKTS